MKRRGSAQCCHKKPVGNSIFFCVEPAGHQCPHSYSVSMDDLLRVHERAEKAEAALAAARDDAEAARRLLGEAATTMRHAETFIRSREKMHHVGIDLYVELLDAIDAALASRGEGE